MKEKVVGVAYDNSAKTKKEKRAKEKEILAFIRMIEKEYLNKDPNT